MYCIQVSVCMSLYTLHPKLLIFCRNNSSIFSPWNLRSVSKSWVDGLHQNLSSSTIHQANPLWSSVWSNASKWKMVFKPRKCIHNRVKSEAATTIKVHLANSCQFAIRFMSGFSNALVTDSMKVKLRFFQRSKKNVILDATLHEDRSNHMWLIRLRNKDGVYWFATSKPAHASPAWLKIHEDTPQMSTRVWPKQLGKTSWDYWIN